MASAILARACGLPQVTLAKIEAGGEGLVGELQDYLTRRGENVSWLASEQGRLLANAKTRED